MTTTKLLTLRHSRILGNNLSWRCCLAGNLHPPTRMYRQLNTATPGKSIPGPLVSMDPSGTVTFSNSASFGATGRLLSTIATEHVTNEHEFDCLLREREMKMHRHPLGPVSKISKLATRALKGKQFSANVKILDLHSQPADSIMKIAKDFPQASIDFICLSPETSKVVSEQANEMNLPNINVLQSSSNNLGQFTDASVDLVLSCYGLQSQPHTRTIVDEIHRVLKPGGTMIAAVWDHLGTEPVVNKMMTRVVKGRNAKVKDSLPLTPSLTTPHLVETMIQESGLWCVSIDRGEYPLFLSRDRSPTSAFDLASLPIKNELGSLMMSGERPHAFEDARAAFDDMIKAKKIRKDIKGRFVIDDNYYKVIVARRKYEDRDSLIGGQKGRSTVSENHLVAAGSVPLDAISKFDKILEASFTNHLYSPMSHLQKAVKEIIKAGGHDTRKIRTIDVWPRSKKMTPELFWTETLPDAIIHSVDISSEGRHSEEMKTMPKTLDIEIVKVGKPQLSSIPDKSLDIVTCIFGLAYVEDPYSLMNEIHRVLKPGGSLVGTTWDSISLEHISNRIMSKVIGPDHVDIHLPTDFLNISKFTAPHMLEKLVEHGGLSVIKSEHYEFPFVLAQDGIVNDDTFNMAILPIRQNLKRLQESGSHPEAFSDARKAFDAMLENGEQMNVDKHGCLITDPNRFNLVVARRLHEDADGIWSME